MPYNVGGAISGATIIIPNDGRQYIVLISGPVAFANDNFLYTDGSAVKEGSIVVQGAGTVSGLP